MSLCGFLDVRPFFRITDPLFLPLGGADHLKFNTDEKEDRYELIVEIPGVAPEDIKVEVADNILSLIIEKKEKSYYKLRDYGRYISKINMPKNVSCDNIQANYKHGVLTLILPKVECQFKRRINIDCE